MTYRVDWLDEAEAALAQACLDTGDRTALAQSVNRLDKYLATIPLDVGRPLSSSVHRIFGFDSLVVEFNVIEDDKHVFVMDIMLVE